MRFQGSMTLGQLIDSSADVESLNGIHSYGKDTIFEKEFGHIYYSDKVAYYNEDYKILEIRLVFGSKSADYAGVHVVRMAFYGVEGTIYDSQQSLYDEFDFGNETRGRRTTRVASMTRNERVTNSIFDGIVIPCASRAYSNEGGGYTPNGKVFYSKTGITLNTKCAISCTCPSYKYTFAQANWLNKVHLGQQPEKYSKRPDRYNKKAMIKVHDGSGKVTKAGIKWNFREVKNSNMNKWVLNMKKAPGMCKHIMMAAMLLMDGTIIEPGKNYIKDYNMETLRRTVRSKLANTNKSDPGTNNKERKYVSEVVKSLEKSQKENVKKKTANVNGETKDISVNKKSSKNLKESLLPDDFNSLIGSLSIKDTIFENLAYAAAGDNYDNESIVKAKANMFIQKAYTDADGFKDYIEGLIRTDKTGYFKSIRSDVKDFDKRLSEAINNIKNRRFS